MPRPPARRRTLVPGKKLAGDRFTLLRKLGEGGNGVVWLARHENLQTEVAIKFPSGDDQQWDFEDEIRSHVALSNQHPNIVSILDVSRSNGLTFVVMQYLSGGSLQAQIRLKREHENESRVFDNARWLLAIADALDFIHSKGIIHRDVKPANILLDTSFSTYLSDFGIASSSDPRVNSTSETQIVGSLPYIAPEVLHSKNYGPHSDQFALGVSAYEVITKRRPFAATNSSELAEAFRTAEILLPSQLVPGLPPSIDTAIWRAINLDASKRFSSCGEFAAEINRDWHCVKDAWHRLTEINPRNRRSVIKPLPMPKTDQVPHGESNELISSEQVLPPKKIKLSRILHAKRDQDH